MIVMASLEIQGQNSNKQDTEGYVDKLISISDSILNREKGKADSLFAIAWRIIKNDSITDNKILSDAYHLQGRIFMRNRNYEEGIIHFKKSYNIKKQHLPDSSKLISKSLNNIGVCYFRLSNYDSANHYYELAKVPLEKDDIWGIDRYFSYLNLGISNSGASRYKIALDYFDSAYITMEKGDMLDDSAIVGYYYYNVALNTTNSGKLEEANEYYKLSEEIYSNLVGNNNYALASINLNKGVNSYYGYDLEKAELYFKKALGIFNAMDFQNSEAVTNIYINLGEIYEAKQKHKKAIDYFNLGIDTKPNDDLKLVLYNQLANCYSDLNDFDNAIKYFNKSLLLLGNENINPKRAHKTYLYFADFLLDRNDFSESLKYYRKAMSAASNHNGKESKDFAEILIKIGQFYIKTNSPDSAFAYFSRASETFKTNQFKSVDDNLNIVFQKEAEIGIGQALNLKYQKTSNIKYLISCYTLYGQLLTEMEMISSRLSTTNKLLLLELINPVYVLAIESSYSLYDLTNDIKYQESIINYIERSKSATLLAEVNTENALKTSDISSETFEFEHQLKDEINGITQMLENERLKKNAKESRIQFFENKLLELMNTYDSLISEIEANYPKYYSVKHYNKVISLKEIQSKLEEDEVILEYVLTDTTLYSVGISKSVYEVASIQIDSTFYNALNYLISIKEVNLDKQNLVVFNKFKESSYLLWEKLIEPHSELIGNSRIIIIPDGLLGYLSFDILIEYDYESEKINYRDLPFILRNHPISYSYSSTLRYNTYFEKGEGINTRNILAFAPLYDSHDSIDSQLSDLAFSESEVNSIVDNHGGKAFIDEYATKENFIHNSGSTEILHLAMHAVINDSLPLQSKLVFYKNDADSTSNYMFTHEIYNLDIDASMVTLSACNTGSGKFSKGEGIMSLARGFVYAGVPSIVMTLWEVQDATGAKLMDKYYTYLFDGMKKDEALQHAKLTILKDANMASAHPFFWSAYVINGDTKEVFKIEKDNNSFTIIGIFLILIILVVIIRLRSRRNK